uniref:Protein-glutamine gamma-glutamyltransferase 2 n=1 Tax=Sinocyclocheilus grahami TaxID=75366 RepID=A0A672PPX0_SINGR
MSENLRTVMKVDLQCVKNNTDHHTNEITVERLIIRRGQAFSLILSAERLDHNDIEITAETGNKNTRYSHNSSISKHWSVVVLCSSPSAVTLSVLCPSDACIGLYSLSVRSGACASVSALTVLFNPWSKDDGVFLASDAERQEFVMNEQGMLYKGVDEYITNTSWDFGQFEEDILDICLKLLDVNPKCLKNAAEDYSARCNPIYISRVVSAMINSDDDKGVLMGQWDGTYIGGVVPSNWSSSVDILRSWIKYDCHPVKFGQCWVFAAVMCTVLRCLGIPCRVVTNYQSAHDTDQNLVIDEYFSDYGVRPKRNLDSVWNYHVWVEGWMRRPDLSQDSLYDGWQVLDPTPQEKSSGTYCCGPAPVKAILEGHTDVKYDIPFVYGEVNADKITWLVMANGSKKKILSDTKTVGQNISTKAVGSDSRQDITDQYKHPEGQSHTHTHTHTRSYSITITHTHTHTHSLILTITHSYPQSRLIITYTHTHTHNRTLTITHTHTHNRTLTHTYSQSLTHILIITHTHTHNRTLTHTYSQSLTHILIIAHSHIHTHNHSHTYPQSHSQSLTHTHNCTLTITHTYSQSHTHTYSQSLTHTHSQSLTHILTIAHSQSLTHTHNHSHTHS